MNASCGRTVRLLNDIPCGTRSGVLEQLLQSFSEFSKTNEIGRLGSMEKLENFDVRDHMRHLDAGGNIILNMY